MKTVSPSEMRELDRRTIEEFGTPGEVLMERAGQGLADSILRRRAWLGDRCRAVTAVAGRGNNGGDAFVAARIIAETGMSVRALTTCDAEEYKGDAATHLKRMLDAGVSISPITDPGAWEGLAADARGEIVIDGVLGTGTKGAARGAAEAAIKWINRLKQANAIVAIDIPSGLDGESGTAEGETVVADWTVTMGFPKKGLIATSALEYVGNLEVVDIGIPAEYSQELGSPPAFLSASEALALTPSRSAASHKGSHGTALVIAGSGSFPGAAVLCAMGAVRSGAGLVHVMTTENAAPAVTAAVPEAIVRSMKADASGALLLDDIRHGIESLPKYNSVVIGPGMTDSDSTCSIVEWVLRNVEMPIVLDADALNVVARCGADLARTREDLVLTPHPGEAGKLSGLTAGEIQKDRLAALTKLRSEYAGVIVLKGAGTLISSGDAQCINLTGNAGMAKGGSGDVLAGLIGGLLAQGLSCIDAAKLGVYTHGRAGDIAAFRGSGQGMTASDTASAIADAFSSLA